MLIGDEIKLSIAEHFGTSSYILRRRLYTISVYVICHEKLSLLSPNYLGLRIMLNTIYDGSQGQIRQYMVVLWTASLLLFIISALKGRRTWLDYIQKQYEKIAEG